MIRSRAAVVLIAGLVLAGCGEDRQAGGATPPTTTAATSSGPAGDTAAPTQAPAVPEQLRFTAQTVDGEEFSGESLAGKPAVLWFWAPWCPKCQAEAPTIADAARDPGDVRFVGVAAQDEVPAMRDFVQRFGLGSFPHLADTDAAVWQRFGVTYQPAYAFIGSDGAVEVVTDQLGAAELRAKVAALN